MKDVPCRSGLSRFVPRSHSDSPLSCGHANALDARLGALATQLQATQDKFAGLRAAFAMKPLIARRNVVQDVYVFLSQDHAGYETERFENLKKLYNDRLAAVKVVLPLRSVFSIRS